MSEHEQNLSEEAQEPAAEEVVLPPLTPQSEPATASPEPEAEVASAEAEVVEAEAASEPAAEAAPAEAEVVEAEAASEPAAEAAPAEPEEAEVEAVSEPAAEAVPAEPEEAEVEAAPEPAAEAAPAKAKEPAPEKTAVDQSTEEEEVFKRPRTIRDLKKGMVLEGKVTSVAIYGAFVDIGVGREGLVHISQLSDQSVSSPTEVVQIGDMVSVRVLDVDPRSRRISLTMRERVEPKVDREQLKALTPGTVLDGTVTSLTRFGAFVDIGVGRDGLVPLSQIGLQDEQQASDVLKIGEPVRVRVLDVDQKRGRIRLSMRNIYDEDALADLRPGVIVRGRVTGMAAFGAFVDVGVGKDGLVHVSELGEESVGHPREVLKVGQEIEVRVVEVDMDTQRISLSLQLEEEEEAWEPAWQEETEEEEELPEQATLEDLLTHFSAMRPSSRSEEAAGASQAEKEKLALREAQQRTLEKLRQQEE